MLNHGDQLMDENQIFRIAAKTYGPEGIEPRMWISKRLLGEVDVNPVRHFLDPLPPFVPAHLIAKVPFYTAAQYRFVPVSENSEELIIAGPDDDPLSEDNLSFTLGDKPLVFWKTRNESFETALQSYYTEGSVDACGENLQYQCPRKWNDLKHTDRSEVRFCEGCNENVYLILNNEESEFHRKHAHCIARPNFPEPQYMVMGVAMASQPDMQEEISQPTDNETI